MSEETDLGTYKGERTDRLYLKFEIKIIIIL
jgi:hypothetical protein